MDTSPKAVVLLSGGLDSTTVLALAKSQGFELYALSFDYGQRNRHELQRAEAVARCLGAAEHKKITLDYRAVGGSSLTSLLPVEKNRSFDEMGRNIPSTYVPARNTLFLAYALGWAEVLDSADIFIGVNAVDTSGYPDCRPEFISAFEKLASLATRLGTEQKKKITIHAPLQRLKKFEIIQKGIELGINYGLTNSCYDPLPEGLPCGGCDACLLRQKGFYEAGWLDPLPYQTRLQPMPPGLKQLA